MGLVISQQVEIGRFLKHAFLCRNVSIDRCCVGCRYLVERVDNMKRNVLGNGTSQCLLCGEEFGLLGASASECEECSKVGSVMQ